MSAETWMIIAIVGFSLAGVALIIAIFMFTKMKIPSVIGDLSGKTVAREIKEMKELNSSKGDRSFRPSKVNIERGTLTETVVLSNDSTALNATTVLNSTEKLDKESDILSPVNFKVTKSYIVTHTDEVI